MSTFGHESGVDLVRQMQKDGDLENKFIMFDYVKCIPYWSTLGVHVYDSIHCKVMTIFCCEMKSEITQH